MTKRLFPFLLLLLSSHCWATWTCADGATGCTVTTNRTCTTTGTSCSITVASTASGSVGVTCIHTGSTTVTLTVTGGGTWTTPAGSHGTDSTAGGAECAYNLNMTASTTAVTCTFSATNANNECQYFNFTSTGSSFTFDTSNAVDDSTACTSCNGVALTLGTSNNYVLIQTIVCGSSCSAINQSYTAAITAGGDGTAFKINVTTAGTTPLWTATSGRAAGGAIAIYEVASGTTPSGFNKERKYEQVDQ